MNGNSRRAAGYDWLPQLLMLPFKAMSFGLGLMTETARRLGELATPAGLAWASQPQNAAPAAAPPGLPPASPASNPTPTTAPAGAASSPAAVAYSAPTPLKEERNMSTCGCSNDLSGCDVLKVVQYAVVSVNPYIENWERIIVPSITVAITDDMTESDFTTFAIAHTERYYRERGERNPLDGRIDEYLRVCFSVFCRLNMPCANYEKQQAEVLAAINRTLKEKNRDKSLGSGRDQGPAGLAKPPSGGSKGG